MTIAGSPEIMRHHELVSAVAVLLLMAYILYQHQVMQQAGIPAKPDKGKAALRAVLFAAAAGGVLCIAYKQSLQPKPQYAIAVNPLSTKM